MANRWGNNERLYFLELQNHYRWWLNHEIKKHLLLGRKTMFGLDNILKSRDITLPTKVSLLKAMVIPVVMYGCESWTFKLSAREFMLLSCGVGEDSWESLGLQGDPTSPSWRKSVLNIHWKDWCWAATPIFWTPDVKNWLIWKHPDAGLKKGGEGDDRGWDGWMASLTQLTWAWVSSRSWWWTGKPDVLQSMGPQRLGHDWAIELNWMIWRMLKKWHQIKIKIWNYIYSIQLCEYRYKLKI